MRFYMSPSKIVDGAMAGRVFNKGIVSMTVLLFSGRAYMYPVIFEVTFVGVCNTFKYTENLTTALAAMSSLKFMVKLPF